MKQGITVPSVTFKTRVRDDSIGGDNPFKWQDLTTDEIFKNRRVVVFSLPGAFTPTCSTYQVPGYEKHYDEICAKGVDDIYVLSVNDTFVMRKWMLDQQVEKLKFIPDGSGTFTRQLGMLVDKDNLGFGMRSWRYAMIVYNGVIEQFFEEPGRCDNSAVDPYGVSSPETVLEYLNRHEK
jgi:thioredoxin-dependent peroxiredoxin